MGSGCIAAHPNPLKCHQCDTLPDHSNHSHFRKLKQALLPDSPSPERVRTNLPTADLSSDLDFRPRPTGRSSSSMGLGPCSGHKSRRKPEEAFKAIYQSRDYMSYRQFLHRSQIQQSNPMSILHMALPCSVLSVLMVAHGPFQCPTGPAGFLSSHAVAHCLWRVAQAHTHTPTQVNIYMYTYIYTDIHISTYTHIYRHTRMHHMYVSIFRYLCECMYASILKITEYTYKRQTHVQIPVFIHEYMHACMHTVTYILTYTYYAFV